MTRTFSGGRASQGFSLIELLAAAAILGLLATVAVPFVETSIKRQKEQGLRIALRDIRQGIDAYKKAVVDGQIKLADIDASGYPATLTDLVAGAPNEKNGGKPLYFLRRIPRDPFYADASAAAIDTWGLRSFASSDKNPAKGKDVFDVYSTSDATGLNGVPYREW
ncbi:prepilin-type N-terminal cleavage/methylation domain-containing protein [Duganella sp. BJB1802]|uniref:prepilin-type N-terminal cleavage/methylation domain-containing protein n=1 Tax=Duganella sp. BJB1802 TaxID=2744575 RepID=UPI001593F4AB|nr:prepilin-type N-terminal cleavage/methylation domain-containing protein [Duganella sp. BJB1802]NVD69561.1 prepilin-type N-terminal cleavage/methylation domain-containing protein [Duganella sp. BJB1802]